MVRRLLGVSVPLESRHHPKPSVRPPEPCAGQCWRGWLTACLAAEGHRPWRGGPWLGCSKAILHPYLRSSHSLHRSNELGWPTLHFEQPSWNWLQGLGPPCCLNNSDICVTQRSDHGDSDWIFSRDTGTQPPKPRVGVCGSLAALVRPSEVL